MLMGLYILGDDGRTPILTREVEVWGRWFESADRTVRSTRLVWGVDWRDGMASEAAASLGAPHLHVSTAFLGIDQGLSETAPVLWETMILGNGVEIPSEHVGSRLVQYSARGLDDEYQERYSSYESAVSGHARAVRIGRRLIKKARPVVASRE